MLKSLNKGISTPIAIAIVLLLAVSVGGVIFWQYSELGKEKIKPIELGDSEKDETVDWKVYENKDFGLRIKYPVAEGVRIKQNIIGTNPLFSVGSVEFNKKFKNNIFSTKITTLSPSQFSPALDQPFSEIEENGFRIILGVYDSSSLPCIYTDGYTKLINDIEEINIGSIVFKKARTKNEEQAGYTVQFCGVKNDITYFVHLSDYDSFHDRPSLLIDQILSTFSLFEPEKIIKDETTDWETYVCSCPEIFFSVDYPPELSNLENKITDMYPDPCYDVTPFVQGDNPNASFEVAISWQNWGKETPLGEMPLEEIANEYKKGLLVITPKIKDIKEKQIMLADNVPAIKLSCIFEEEQFQYINVVGLVGDNLIKVVCTSKDKECESTFDQMLSTFKFTPRFIE